MTLSASEHSKVEALLEEELTINNMQPDVKPMEMSTNVRMECKQKGMNRQKNILENKQK